MCVWPIGAWVGGCARAYKCAWGTCTVRVHALHTCARTCTECPRVHFHARAHELEHLHACVCPYVQYVCGQVCVSLPARTELRSYVGEHENTHGSLAGPCAMLLDLRSGRAAAPVGTRRRSTPTPDAAYDARSDLARGLLVQPCTSRDTSAHPYAQPHERASLHAHAHTPKRARAYVRARAHARTFCRGVKPAHGVLWGG